MVKNRFTKKDILAASGCVLFLITLLGSMGISSKGRTRDAVCRANLRRLGAAIHAVAKDNGGYLSDDRNSWIRDISPYYRTPGLLLCPEANKLKRALGGNVLSVRGGTFNPWGILEYGRTYICSYGINQYCSMDNSGGRELDELWRSIYAAGASRAPLLLDCAGIGMTPHEHDQPPEYDGQIYFSDPANIDEIRSFCLNRHNAAVNCVYMDLSVRKIGLKSLWIQKWHRQWNLPPDPLPTWPDWMSNFKDPE